MHAMSSARHAPAPHHLFQHAASSPLIEHRGASTSTDYHHRSYLVAQQATPSSGPALQSPRARSPMYGPQPHPGSVGGETVHPHPRAHSPRPPSPSPTPTPHPHPHPRAASPVVTTESIEVHRHRGRLIVNKYVFGQRVGNGQHGEVFQAYDMTRDNMLVAIKVCKRRNPKEAKMEQLRQRNQSGLPRSPALTGDRLLAAAASNNAYAVVNGLSKPRLVDQLQNTEKKVLREIAIMKKCQHGQIVQLYEIINDIQASKILLVMEFMGGGEVKWRNEEGFPCLRVDQSRRICRDVVLGLDYLHYQGIIHRDIKPANLLWTSDRKNVKITDFGVSHFSAPQRIEALRRSKKELEMLERTKRERAISIGGSVWGRGRARGSRDDMKGKGKAEPDEVEAELMKQLVGELDPILMDDGGLSRQAGTPSFLAPEIIWEFGEAGTAALLKRAAAMNRPPPPVPDKETTRDELKDNADEAPNPATPRVPAAASSTDSGFVHVANNSNLEDTIPDPDPTNFIDPNAAAAALESDKADAAATEQSAPSLRPPITKAIDVWALGVTLYCLLFGRVPWPAGNEFMMYKMIHEEDFGVGEVMGYDKIATGGRVHEENDKSEGAVVTRLLGRLLEKDCSKRITLEEIKMLPWITRDIPNPEEWMRETSPVMQDPIAVTSADEDVAVSSLKFKWQPWRFLSRLNNRRQRAQEDAQARAMVHHRDALNSYDFPPEKGSAASLQRAGRRNAIDKGSDNLQRKPSRSRRLIDGVERNIKRISRQSSAVYGPASAGEEKQRSGGRRQQRNHTLPDLMSTQSKSREGSRSRPASRASLSGLTSPSTAGWTSDADFEHEHDEMDDENEVFDSAAAVDDGRPLRDRQEELERVQQQPEKGREGPANQKPRAQRNSMMRYLGFKVGGGSRSGELSESSSGASFPNFGFGGRKGLGKRTPPAPSGQRGHGSFAERRLMRRSADEFGERSRGGAPSGRRGGAGSRGEVQSVGSVTAASSKRTSSGPATASEYGYSYVRRQRGGLASAEELGGELPAARRASSWGDVVGNAAAIVSEHDYAYMHGAGHDFGYAGSPYGGFGDGGNGEGDVDVDADADDGYDGEFDAGSTRDYGYGYGDGDGDADADYGYASGDAGGEMLLDDEVRLVGAGGVLTHSGPVSGPSSPNSLSGVSVGVGVGAATTTAGTPGVAVIGQGAGGGPTSIQITTTLSPGTAQGRPRARSFGREGGGGTHLSSPLARTPLNLDCALASDFFSLEPEEGDDARSVYEGQGQGQGQQRVYGRGATRLVDDDDDHGIGAGGGGSDEGGYGDGEGSDADVGVAIEFGSDDEEEEDEDVGKGRDVFETQSSDSSVSAPIEVRRRRPSEVLAARSMSRPRPEIEV